VSTIDAETIKRLKAWFYLRLAPEDWSKFGSSASQVLQTFDDDPDQANALLRFVEVVVLLEIRKLRDPRLVWQIIKQRLRELRQLGLTKEQLRKASRIDPVAAGYYEIARDARGQPIHRDGEPVYVPTEKGRKLMRMAFGPPPLPPQQS
jgi:hypothetical protein